MITKLKKLIYTLIIFLYILLFVSPFLSAQAACPQGKVVLVGDSVTNAYGPVFKSQCPDAQVDIYATDGQSTSSMRSSFDSNILNKGYSQVIILGGVNNIGNVSAVENDLQYMYSKAKQSGIAVTAVTITPWKGYSTWSDDKQRNTENINNWILGSAKDVDNRVNAYQSLVDPNNPGALRPEYTTDKLHPNTSAGKQALSSTISGSSFSAPTGQTQSPIPGTDGTAPITATDTTAAPPTYERTSTLISGNSACEIWKNAFNLGISFIGVIALAGVIWGGFGYITSYGNQEKVTSAKETIWGSVTGLFIGLFAYVLFSMINPYVLQCKIEAPFKLSKNGSGTNNPSGNNGTDTGPGATPTTGEIKDCENAFVVKLPYDTVIKQAAEANRIDPHFLKAIIRIESGFGANIGPSSAGAYGISQFMPGTFAGMAPSGVPDSCKKKSGQSTAIGGYCVNEKGRNPACCQASPKSCQQEYAPDCMAWIKNHPNEMIYVSAKLLAINKRNSNGSYFDAAAKYNGGAGYYRQAGPQGYARSAANYDATYCKQSGGQ